MLAAALAALLLTTPVAAVTQSTSATQPSAVTTANGAQNAVRLEDLTVTGRPLDQLVDTFTQEVAAPNPGRNLARWRDSVCVGAVNIQTEGAHYLIDRISTVARDVGLRAGSPGCTPNVVIIAVNNPSELAQSLVERRKFVFRVGGSGMDRGGPALRAFMSSEKPVRWWQVSMPIDSTTLQRATRIPGDMSGSGDSVFDYAPSIKVLGAARASTQIVNDIQKTIVIIDANDMGRVSSQQLADYVAMVTLAQINPDADTSHYATILNVFDADQGVDGLTEWDKAYLKGLYDSQRTRLNLNSGRLEIASSIVRAHRQLMAEQDE